MTEEQPVLLNGSYTAAGQPASLFKNTPPPLSGMVGPSVGLTVMCSCQASSPQTCVFMVTLRHTTKDPTAYGTGEPGFSLEV